MSRPNRYANAGPAATQEQMAPLPPTTKPDVLAVMERDGIAADTHRQAHAANDLRQRMWRESEEARATVERLAEAAEAVIRSPRRPPSIEARQNLAAALAAFRGEQA